MVLENIQFINGRSDVLFKMGHNIECCVLSKKGTYKVGIENFKLNDEGFSCDVLIKDKELSSYIEEHNFIDNGFYKTSYSVFINKVTTTVGKLIRYEYIIEKITLRLMDNDVSIYKSFCTIDPYGEENWEE